GGLCRSSGRNRQPRARRRPAHPWPGSSDRDRGGNPPGLWSPRRRETSAMRPVLIVGGAPRVAIDAVRHLTVAATGATAVQLADLLQGDGVRADLLLSVDA